MSEESWSRRNFVFSAASLFAAAPLLRAQKDTTFSSDVKVVNVLATVRNKRGEIVRNLKKEDFTLEEDGRPQTIKYFSQESNLPLTLGLLVDTSMSQRRVLPDESRASYKFLEQVLREDKDQAFVIHFDREVELLQDLTSSRKKLETSLSSLSVPERPQFGNGGGAGGGAGGGGGRRIGRDRVGTAFYDAVMLASDELMKKQSGRKALVMLTDGVDVGSKVSLMTAIETAQRADTLLYSVLFADEQGYGRSGLGMGRPGGMGGGMGRRGGIGGMGGGRGGMGGPRGGGQGRQRPDGKKILQQMSSETGGGFFEVSKKHSIDQIFKQLEEELRNQYSLGYTSDQANANSGFRKIHLTTRDKSQVVQTRDGYYPDAAVHQPA
jgi:VWFA-related protein